VTDSQDVCDIMNQKTIYLDVEQAAAFLNVSPKYVYTLTQQRKIPFYKPFGKKLMFKAEELQDIVDASQVKSVTPIEELKQRIR
jgi:excisionase family DNA binding protein